MKKMNLKFAPAPRKLSLHKDTYMGRLKASSTPGPTADNHALTAASRLSENSSLPADTPVLPSHRLPDSVAALHIPENFLAHLLLKHCFYLEIFTLKEIAERLKLPAAITVQLIDYLRREKYIEIRGSSGLTGGVTAISQAYRYSLSDSGKHRAAHLFEFDSYVGPAPVTLEEYWLQVEAQTVQNCRISQKRLREGFQGLVISESLFDQLGPAVVSGKPIFIYGPPGNGKTTIAMRLGALWDDYIMIPYAIYVEGNIVRVFDEASHHRVPLPPDFYLKADSRWVACQRPAVLVGGEMTLEMLDLAFNPILKYYEAPLQLKANNGLFIVDDFGRQRTAPQEMLNRWIIPMENRRDFLCLHTGHKFTIPFDQLIIFSTNLPPESLVDGAFLRRLRHKIKIDHITPDQFKTIFRMTCEKYGVQHDPGIADYLIDNYFVSLDRPIDACTARDLIEHIIDISRFEELPPQLSQANIDRACNNYFVN